MADKNADLTNQENIRQMEQSMLDEQLKQVAQIQQQQVQTPETVDIKLATPGTTYVYSDDLIRLLDYLNQDEDSTSHDNSSALRNDLSVGFIPAENRIGSRAGENGPVFTKELVDEIRSRVDPAFGYCGLCDTSVQPDYTVNIDPDNFSQFTPFLGGELSPEDIMKASCSVFIGSAHTKVYNDDNKNHQKIIGDYSACNLIELNLTTEDGDSYRTHFLMNDMGKCLGTPHFSTDNMYMNRQLEVSNENDSLKETKTLYIPELDKTSRSCPVEHRLVNPEQRKDFDRYLEHTGIDNILGKQIDAFENRISSALGGDGVNTQTYLGLREKCLSRNIDNYDSLIKTIGVFKEYIEHKAYTYEKQADACMLAASKAYEESFEVESGSSEYKDLQEKYSKSLSGFAQNYHSFQKLKGTLERIEKFIVPVEKTYTKIEGDIKAITDSLVRIEDEERIEKISSSDINVRLEQMCTDCSKEADDTTGIGIFPAVTNQEIDNVFDPMIDADIIPEVKSVISEIVSEYNAGIDSDDKKISFSAFTYYDHEDILNSILQETLDQYNSGLEEDEEKITLETFDFDDHISNIRPMLNEAIDHYREKTEGEGYQPLIAEFNKGGTVFRLFDSNGNDLSFSQTDEIYKDFHNFFAGERINELKHGTELEIPNNLTKEIYLDLNTVMAVANLHLQDSAFTIQEHRDEIEDKRQELYIYGSVERINEVQNPQKDDFEGGMGINNTGSKNTTDKDIRRATEGAAGKHDDSKAVEISDKKLEEYKTAAYKEAGGDQDKADQIYKEKVDALTNRLEHVKADIETYSKKMEETGGNLSYRLLSSYIPYQDAKIQYDTAVYAYAHIGGKTGENTFVTKVPNESDLYADKKGVINSNYCDTIIICKLTGKDFNEELEKIHKDDDKDDILQYDQTYARGMKKIDKLLKIEGPVIRALTNHFIKEMKGDINNLEKYVADRYDDPDNNNKDNPDKKDPDKEEIEKVNSGLHIFSDEDDEEKRRILAAGAAGAAAGEKISTDEKKPDIEAGQQSQGVEDQDREQNNGVEQGAEETMRGINAMAQMEAKGAAGNPDAKVEEPANTEAITLTDYIDQLLSNLIDYIHENVPDAVIKDKDDAQTDVIIADAFRNAANGTISTDAASQEIVNEIGISGTDTMYEDIIRGMLEAAESDSSVSGVLSDLAECIGNDFLDNLEETMQTVFIDLTDTDASVWQDLVDDAKEEYENHAGEEQTTIETDDGTSVDADTTAAADDAGANVDANGATLNDDGLPDVEQQNQDFNNDNLDDLEIFEPDTTDLQTSDIDASGSQIDQQAGDDTLQDAASDFAESMADGIDAVNAESAAGSADTGALDTMEDAAQALTDQGANMNAESVIDSEDASDEQDDIISNAGIDDTLNNIDDDDDSLSDLINS